MPRVEGQRDDKSPVVPTTESLPGGLGLDLRLLRRLKSLPPKDRVTWRGRESVCGLNGGA